jgi:transposase
MRPISSDKRKLIIAAHERGETSEAIALWMNVSVSSVYNVRRLYRKSGTISPKPFPGRRSILTSEQLCRIREVVEAQNDITLEELISKLKLPIKKSRLSVILIKMGFSFKKKHSTPKNNIVTMSKQNGLSGEHPNAQ